MRSDCKCTSPPFHFADFDTVEIGGDESGAEVFLDTCKSCGQMWVKYLIEEPHYSKSGRWWRAPVTLEQYLAMTAPHARAFIESQPWRYVGGSFFDSTGRKVLGPNRVV